MAFLHIIICIIYSILLQISKVKQKLHFFHYDKEVFQATNCHQNNYLFGFSRLSGCSTCLTCTSNDKVIVQWTYEINWIIQRAEAFMTCFGLLVICVSYSQIGPLVIHLETTIFKIYPWECRCNSFIFLISGFLGLASHPLVIVFVVSYCLKHYLLKSNTFL